jgi:hypothetical protein
VARVLLGGRRRRGSGPAWPGLGLVFVALSLHLEKAEAPGIPVLGLYLLAAGSAALIASATRSTWTQLLFGRTQSLE